MTTLQTFEITAGKRSSRRKACCTGHATSETRICTSEHRRWAPPAVADCQTFKPLCTDSHRLPAQQRSKYEPVTLPLAAGQGTIALFILKSLFEAQIFTSLLWMHAHHGGKHSPPSGEHSSIGKLILFSLHVGTLGSLQAPCFLWHCRCRVSRNRAKAACVLATQLRSCQLRVRYSGSVRLGWLGVFLPAVAASRHILMNLFLVAFLSCFTEKAVIPWHLKQ